MTVFRQVEEVSRNLRDLCRPSMSSVVEEAANQDTRLSIYSRARFRIRLGCFPRLMANWASHKPGGEKENG